MRSKVTGLIQDFHALNETEKQVFLDLVDPQPEQVPVRRTRKKRATSAPPAAQKRGLPQSLETPAESGAKCGICGNVKDHSDHDRNYIKSHDFEPTGQKRSRKLKEVSSDVSEALAASASGD